MTDQKRKACPFCGGDDLGWQPGGSGVPFSRSEARKDVRAGDRPFSTIMVAEAYFGCHACKVYMEGKAALPVMDDEAKNRGEVANRVKWKARGSAIEKWERRAGEPEDQVWLATCPCGSAVHLVVADTDVEGVAFLCRPRSPSEISNLWVGHKSSVTCKHCIREAMYEERKVE